MKLTRRHLWPAGLAALAGLGGVSWLWPKPAKAVSGTLKGANAALGHRLRTGCFPAPVAAQQHDVVIVGSGIAGLAAGYNLHKGGVTDFRILELEDRFGGNAQGGENAVSAYPWGAHYVPLLSEESTDIKALFEAFNIITGHENGLPLYNEDYIINDPDERLFLHGRWQNGLMPVTGVTADDHAQYRRFLAQMDAFKTKRGPDGRRWFAIPVDQSSIDPDARALDGLTMQDWMTAQGYTSEPLHWFVNYGCRDDFGITYDQISAYAGLHYFAARNGQAANTHADSVLTWPEGNAFLANKLAEPIREKIVTQALTYAVRKTNDGVEIDYWDDAAQTSRRLKARAVVMAMPRFIATRLMPDLAAEGFSYAPWAVANITLDRLPEGTGAALSWDNVVYDSPTLGYVVATHQLPQMRPLRTVITWYWPLTHLPPAEARKEALTRDHAAWQTLFLDELYRVHPELKGAVAQADVWLWGHAMIRPVPGFVWGDARQAALKPAPPVFTAHSDLSGLSIFEEAYSHGLNAARNVLDYLK